MATTKVPAAIAHLSSSAQFGWSSQTDWRRECDWDPKASEFGAIILLGRRRLGSNGCTGKTAKIEQVLCNVSLARATAPHNLAHLLLESSARLTGGVPGPRFTTDNPLAHL